MKLPSRFSLAAFVLAGLAAASHAQDAPATPAKAQEKLVEFKDIKVQVQKTPDFATKGSTTDKRWKPKDWIEIEPEFKTERPAGEKKSEVVPELTFKYYVFLNSSVKENARVLTAEVTHTNVPIDEVSHSVVYISPSTILKVTGRPEGNVSLVSYFAVEVVAGSETVGFYSKGPKGVSKNPNENGAKWWSASTAPPQEPALLSKPQSPFGPLWGDFHADVKPK
jgi:hypothetical protein